jgi:hypothetical protein
MPARQNRMSFLSKLPRHTRAITDLFVGRFKREGIGKSILIGFCLYPIASGCLLGNAFGQATLTFAARPHQWLEKEHAFSVAGHAFLIIGLQTSDGIKEEIFGFYPVSGSVMGMIKGPGMLKAEERCGPNEDCGPSHRAELAKRLSEIKETVTIPITLDDRNTVLNEIKKWDNKSTIDANGKQLVPSSDAEYRLFDQNCNDFLAAVASRLGYSTPKRSPLQTPSEFLAAFKPLAAKEREVREARAAAAEEARRAEIAQQKLEQERLDAEARAIPAGWVRCTCPQMHSAYGKWVDGVLYHPPNIYSQDKRTHTASAVNNECTFSAT